MANRYTKRWSTSSIITEMQIITTIRYQLTLVRMVSSKSTTINAGEDVETRGSSYTIGEKVNWCGCYGQQYRGSFNKLKVELPYDPH